MSPKTKKPPKQNEKKRKNPPAPPEPESDDSTSGTEAETGHAGDVEEGNIRLSKSAVHEEYDQISETLQVKTKTGKRIKVKKWKSSCKHCPKVFEHKKHWGLKRHMMSKHPDVDQVADDIDDVNKEEQKNQQDKPVVSKQLKVLDAYVKFLINDGIPLSTSSSPQLQGVC